MWKIIPYSLIQSLLLATGQIMMKMAMKNGARYDGFWKFIWAEMHNFWWLGCGIFMLSATVLWFYILKHFPFSVAYPLSCLSFVFGVFGAQMFLGESVPLHRWIGVFLIVAGAAFIGK